MTPVKPCSSPPGSPSPAGASAAPPPPWRPDRGDGTYRNPVLFADYSDPDAIRVGDDYWLISSSFNHVPGLPILHSPDLVNWTLVNHALPQLVPAEHYAQPRHGEGVWAPSIRHHAGRFWIFYPDPDFGLYATHAADPRGRWSDPALVKAGRGLIDPCPFWDDDGTGYLIHAWARSRSGINNRLTLHRLAPDNLSVLDSGVIVIDGDALPGWHTLEGPKLCRRGAFYYIFAPAGGVTEGYQAVFRSRQIYGPYEPRILLAQGSSPINGPHQGAWVDTPAGEDWFLHFQDRHAYGRVVHLQPLRWENDWPLIGEHIDARGTGQPVSGYRSPGSARPRASAPAEPATSDDFDAPTLGLQWQWQANPQPDWLELDPAASRARLACVPCPSATLWSAPHLLLQKFPAPAFQVTVDLTLEPRSEGDEAGLIVFGYDYAWLGLRQIDGRPMLVHARCHAAHTGAVETVLATQPVDRAAAAIWLRASIEDPARCRFSYSADGRTFLPLGDTFSCTPSHWVGAKIGLFAANRARSLSAKTGHASTDCFAVAPLPA